MATGTTIRRWQALAAGVALVAGASLVAACQPVADPQPPVASVDFEPRLIVTLGPDGVTADAGGREGARLDGPNERTVPRGSVVELRNGSGAGRRVTITRSLVESTDPDDATVWLDTGTMEPDERTVLGFTAVGTYRITATADDAATSELTVHVVA